MFPVFATPGLARQSDLLRTVLYFKADMVPANSSCYYAGLAVANLDACAGLDRVSMNEGWLGARTEG